MNINVIYIGSSVIVSKEGHDCAEDVVSCEDLSLLVTCALELSVVYS